jgi:hypothetical protein
MQTPDLIGGVRDSLGGVGGPFRRQHRPVAAVIDCNRAVVVSVGEVADPSGGVDVLVAAVAAVIGEVGDISVDVSPAPGLGQAQQKDVPV